MHRRNNVVHHRDYTTISQDDGKVETDNIEDLRFHTRPQTIPWSTILFILFFFMGGTVVQYYVNIVTVSYSFCFCFQCCLVISLVIFYGYWESKYDDRAWPAFIIGWIMFIPGAYYMKVIFCAYFNICGHKFEDIPHFNN